jgi:hypothetical protein
LFLDFIAKLVLKTFISNLDKMMLPNSYFDGSRLNAYLAMLKEFEETSQQEVFDNVVKDNVVVVGIRADTVEKCENAMLAVKLKCEYDEIEYDFSDVCTGSFVSVVLETKRQVNRHIRDWTLCLQQDVSANISLRVKNGQWSKIVHNVNKIYFCLTSKQVPDNLRYDLSGCSFNQINIHNYLVGKRKPWFEVGFIKITRFFGFEWTVKRQFEFFIYEKSKRATLYCGGSDVVLRLYKSKKEGDWYQLNSKVYGVKSCVLEGYFDNGVFNVWDLVWYCGKDIRSYVRYLRVNLISSIIRDFQDRGSLFIKMASPVSLYSDIGDRSVLCVNALGNGYTCNFVHRDLNGLVFKLVFEYNALRFKGYYHENLVDFYVVPFPSMTLQLYCYVNKKVECKIVRGEITILGEVDLPVYCKDSTPSEISRLRDYDRQFGTG